MAVWKTFSDLDLSEARKTTFDSLHDCFTRELKPDLRPIDGRPGVLTSPSDGIVGACGRIEDLQYGTDAQLFQAKGFPYRLLDLLGDDAPGRALARQLQGGSQSSGRRGAARESDRQRVQSGGKAWRDSMNLNEDVTLGEQEADFSAVDKARVVEALARVLPPGALMYESEDLRPYECDGLAAYRALPLVVALPTTEAQVVAILKACSELGVPVVARGAGTGLSGGALPHTQGVLLSLARFNRILKLDPHARTAVVQPGVRNLAISEAAAPHGLYYAPDPSSQIACSIGGNVAENSGGVHCLKYGLTVHNLLRVRGVTIDGEVVELGNHALDAPGYDLLALITGSEGMLAVVTEVTVKLTPKPQLAQCVLAAFDDVIRAGDAVAAIIAAGIIPAGLEMMDQAATAAVEEFVRAGYPLDAKAILLCESDGTPEEVAEEIARVRAVLEHSGATEIRVSRDEAERMRFWAGRKAAFPAA
ncbi:MAG: hypothetical protein CVU28_13270, partial [Betaproteobacteria bacterium HGW-Betaproteobacteria-21]